MSGVSEKTLTVIDANQGRRAIFPPDFWRFRDLLSQMTLSAFHAKYLHLKSSFLWYYARPLTITLVFVLLRATAELGGGAPYPVFVLTGVCFWFIFADVFAAVSGAIAREASLIQKVYFPIVILPLAQMLARFADVALALVAIIALQIALGVGTDVELVMLVPVIAQIMLLAFGLGCIVAALSLSLPDVREGANVAIYLGMFVSPVFYAPEAMPPAARAVLHINPMVGSLQGVRGALFETAAFPWAPWAYSCAATLIAVAVGLTLLGRASRNAAELL
ncbi:MAG TPA: ABC transporter permease [Vitreimonas sp.]|nr:ABC transporter permease [Vitreimonas sp.]